MIEVRDYDKRPVKVKLVPVRGKDLKSTISGEELKDQGRAGNCSNYHTFGSHSIVEALFAQQDKIPKGWRGYTIIALGSAGCKGKNGVSSDRCLLWHNNQWVLGNICLTGKFATKNIRFLAVVH